MAHDAAARLSRITAPTQITYGRVDMVTSTRFADSMKGNIRDSELLIFEGCAHAPIYEKVEEFNQKTLRFLQRHRAAGAAYLVIASLAAPPLRAASPGSRDATNWRRLFSAPVRGRGERLR